MDNVKYKKLSDIIVSVFFLFTFCFIVIMGTVYVPITPVKATESQNVATTCGISGIILRADGSVIIDGWKDYSSSRVMSPNPEVAVIAAKDMPTGIEFGKTLIGKTPICFQHETGSYCVPLEALRKVK